LKGVSPKGNAFSDFLGQDARVFDALAIRKPAWYAVFERILNMEIE